MTTYTDQKITNNLNFNGTVCAHTIVTTKPISGIDIESWRNVSTLTNQNQTLDTSWIVNGNMTAVSIDGSGFVLDENLEDISKRLYAKINQARGFNTQIGNNYRQSCESVLGFAAKTKTQSRVLDMFDDIQGIEFSNPIHSAIHFESGGDYFLLLTFSGRCAGVLYEWDYSKFVKKSRFKIGTVDSSAVLEQNGVTFLVTSGRTCDVR